MKFDTPILLLLWRRPETTRRLLEALRPLAPTRLFVACDGPRQEDHDAVAQTRALVEEMVDWPCTVERRYSTTNLGCRDGVGSALSWFFGHVDSGIVLEDDCIPHNDFFTFCADMLRVHAGDERVWVVTGDNFQRGRVRGEASYYYSRYPHCWGWATWRRAWRHYEPSLSFWPTWRDSEAWQRFLPDRVERAYWTDIFDGVHQGRIKTSWAYPWTACVWHGAGLTITPNVNLVENVGFGPGGTHTTARESHLAVPAVALGPITHPCSVESDDDADRFVFDRHFGGATLRFPWVLWTVPRRIALRVAGRVARATGLIR